MSLMKLSPETVRLRRVAKAHSLGEFTLVEYRQTRREVIANFDSGAAGDDDTQPRIRSAVDTERDFYQQVPAERRSGRAWIGWLLAAVALLAASQLFAAAATIPEVSGRDPNPATSPRLMVAEVRFAPGTRSQAGFELDEEKLQAVIDGRLAEIRRRNQPAEHGFTSAELAELGRLLNALGAHNPDMVLGQADAADITALLSDQKNRRGISVAELEEVAAAVQDQLRADGYFLAVAYLPAQTIVDARVHIGLLPGVLGEVQVAGAGMKLADRFGDLVGQAITTREITTRLYALNQAPGFSAQASFEPGSAVGETRLNLTVLEKRGVRGTAALDNHGDEQTGKQRLVLGGDLINPAGRGDVLQAGLITAIDPSNQLLGFVDYTMPIGTRRVLRGSLARNDFSTDFGDDLSSGGTGDYRGDGWLLDLGLETYLHRDRLTGLSWEFGVGRHDLDWRTPAGTAVDQQVTLLTGAVNARRVWDQVRIATDLRLRLDVGRIAGDTFAGQNDRFWDFGFDLFGWHPFDVAMLPGSQKVSLQLKGQFAGTQLPSTRRMTLGGVAGARGFQRDAYLADQGFLLRGDVRTPVRWGELSLFADVGYGKDKNELIPGWAHVANLGAAWEVRFGRYLQSSLSWAVPVTAKGSGALDDDGSQLFWSLRYAY